MYNNTRALRDDARDLRNQFSKDNSCCCLVVSPSRGDTDCNKLRFVFRKNFLFLRASCRLKRTCASNFQIGKKLYHRRNIKFYHPIVLFTTLCYFSKVHYHLNRLSLNYSCSLLFSFPDALKPFLSYNI